MFLSLVIELSKTFTFAPIPIADRAANSPTVPAPMMTTSTGGTPLMFPNINPLPLLFAAINSAAISTEEIPAISLRERTAGYFPSSSRIYSKAIAVIRFLANSSKYSLYWVFI